MFVFFWDELCLMKLMMSLRSLLLSPCPLCPPSSLPPPSLPPSSPIIPPLFCRSFPPSPPLPPSSFLFSPPQPAAGAATWPRGSIRVWTVNASHTHTHTHTHTLKQLKAQLCTRPCSPEGPGSLECVSVWVCWWVCGCPASLFMGHWEMCVSQRRWTGYRGPHSPGLPLILLLLLPLSFLSSTPPLAQGAIHIPDNCEYSSSFLHLPPPSSSFLLLPPPSSSSVCGYVCSPSSASQHRRSSHVHVTHTSFNFFFFFFYISLIFKCFNYMEISRFIWRLEFKVSKSRIKFSYNVESMWINERTQFD